MPGGRPRVDTTIKQSVTLSCKGTKEFAAQVEYEAVRRHMKVSELLRVALEHYLVCTPVTATPPAPTAHITTISSGPEGDQRRQILALLKSAPQGLRAKQIRQLLGVDRDLGSAIRAMARDGLLERLETGVYGVRQNN